MSTTEEHDFRGPGWTERHELHDGLAIIYWPPGGLQGPDGPVDQLPHHGIEHLHVYPADPGNPRDTETRALVAPRLDGHQVSGPFDRLTVSPSILCDCGLHGFLTDGVWRSV